MAPLQYHFGVTPQPRYPTGRISNQTAWSYGKHQLRRRNYHYHWSPRGDKHLSCERSQALSYVHNDARASVTHRHAAGRLHDFTVETALREGCVILFDGNPRGTSSKAPMGELRSPRDRADTLGFLRGPDRPLTPPNRPSKDVAPVKRPPCRATKTNPLSTNHQHADADARCGQ